MKYLFMTLLVLAGVLIGRWSTPPSPQNTMTKSIEKESDKAKTLVSQNCKQQPQPSLSTQEQEQKQNCTIKDVIHDPKFVRTDEKNTHKQVQSLFYKMLKAMNNNDIDEQNQIFREMQQLNPLHEKVFQVKVMFLQQDGDWEGAYTVLKECSEANPESVYCHKRLSNIRSSTIEDKISHGQKCLALQKNDPQCLVDLAIAHRRNGDLEKSKNFFETALNLPLKGHGFDKRYILYQYAFTLEGLYLYEEASAAFTEACDLDMKAACEKIKGKERKTS